MARKTRHRNRSGHRAGDGGACLRELFPLQNDQNIDSRGDSIRWSSTFCKVISRRTACGCDDPRVSVLIQDGLKYIRSVEDQYGLIIVVDSTDSFGPGEGLFTKEFYGNCYKALKEDGIMINQHESPFYENDAIAMQRAHKRIVRCFPISRVYQAHIPTYSSGHWLFGFASKRYHPVGDLKEKEWNDLNLKTRYYNTKLHAGAFALPNYVWELLKDVE